MSDREQNPDAPIFRIYGNTLQEVKIAYLSTGAGVGFEIFEFIDPPPKPALHHFDFSQAGLFHICITAPAVDDAVERVLAKGGRLIGEIVEVGKDLEGNMNKAAYVADPWGTVVEVLSCTFESLMANRH